MSEIVFRSFAATRVFHQGRMPVTAIAPVTCTIASALGFADRRRSFAILVALGARPRQLGVFMWGEALLVLAMGAVVGFAAGGLISCVLVKPLTGVFDPPPEMLLVPWMFIFSIMIGAGAAVAAAVAGTMATSDLRVGQAIRAER